MSYIGQAQIDMSHQADSGGISAGDLVIWRSGTPAEARYFVESVDGGHCTLRPLGQECRMRRSWFIKEENND